MQLAYAVTSCLSCLSVHNIYTFVKGYIWQSTILSSNKRELTGFFVMERESRNCIPALDLDGVRIALTATCENILPITKWIFFIRETSFKFPFHLQQGKYLMKYTNRNIIRLNKHFNKLLWNHKTLGNQWIGMQTSCI